MFRRKYNQTENYQDKIARLYGKNYPIDPLNPNEHRGLTRTCTLQVTDACNLRCTYCVAGSTLITMADGTHKPIKHVNIGDEIIAFDESTGELKKTVVDQIFKRRATMMKIKLEDYRCLHITPNHRVYVRFGEKGSMQWIEAGEIQKYICPTEKDGQKDHIYMYIYDTKLGYATMVRVDSVTYHCDEHNVYNIGTGTHTYFANDIGVHNCYQINKSTHRMSYEVAKKYIDMLLEDDRENDYVNTEISEGLVIEFIGGEPLLEIDLIDKITDYLYDRMLELDHPWLNKYMISICSNGVLYFDERFQKYIEKNKYHLSFSISIDGNKELHDSCRIFPDGSGSYDIAIEGVKHFREFHHGHMGSKMTIAPGNVTKVYEAVVNLIALGYEEIFLNCVYEEGWTADHALILYNQLCKLTDYLIENDLFDKIYLSMFDDNSFRPMPHTDNQNWCGGTGSMLSCDYKGDLYPCIRYMESSLGTDADPLIIGNVYEGLLHNDKEKNIIKCLRCITRRSQSTDECFDCPIASSCSWCSAYNYQTFGTADKRATFICIMHKARTLANAYYWNKGFRKYAPFFRFKMWIPDEWALQIISQEELDMLKGLESFTPSDMEDVVSYGLDSDSDDAREYASYRMACLKTGAPIITNDVIEGDTPVNDHIYVSADGESTNITE